jgi:hypothetical protein
MTSIQRLHASGILRRGTPRSGFRYVFAGGKRSRSSLLPPAVAVVASKKRCCECCDAG